MSIDLLIDAFPSYIPPCSYITSDCKVTRVIIVFIIQNLYYIVRQGFLVLTIHSDKL